MTKKEFEILVNIFGKDINYVKSKHNDYQEKIDNAFKTFTESVLSVVNFDAKEWADKWIVLLLATNYLQDMFSNYKENMETCVEYHISNENYKKKKEKGESNG